MEVVPRQPEPHERAWSAGDLDQGRHDRDGPSHRNRDRRFSESRLQRAQPGLDEGIREIRPEGASGSESAELHGGHVPDQLADVTLEGLIDALGILVPHEAHADLRARPGPGYRLESFAGVSAVDAVHL